MREWLERRDHGLVALRRAARTALVMPALFALTMDVIGSPGMATFAAFGSFAMLMLVDFPGSIRARVEAEAGLALAGAAIVAAGTLVSPSLVPAVLAMGVVGFCVLFAGVVSSVLAGATTSLLLAFILPVSLSAPVSAIPDRLAGWGLAAAAAVPAVALLWPSPARDPVRSAAIAGCRALAGTLYAQAAYAAGRAPAETCDAATADGQAAVEALQSVFFATAYRPTGLSTAARAVVRLVDELRWLSTIAGQAAPTRRRDASAAAVKTAAAELLERGADLLDAPARSPAALRAAVDDLRARRVDLERDAMRMVPVGEVVADRHLTLATDVDELVSAVDPSFRAHELSFVVLQIAANIDLAAAAERRSWLQHLLGRRPAGLAGPLAAAQERAGSYVRWNSVWLRNSVRGAVGLSIAVAVASASGLQHSFWVVLGTLAVLRSNALSTGENVLRALLGTTGGVLVGGALVTLVGTDRTVLWAILPPAVLLAGLAPAAVSFAAGQAAFTLVLVILFNILVPGGWKVGLVRLEDVALGSAVSLAVGLLFWPRGAGGALRAELATAYRDSADYLAGAVRFAVGRCDAAAPAVPAPTQEAGRAAAAARRLDDAFRTYLSERGAKLMPLAEVTSLVTGVVALRLGGDAVLDLWQDHDEADRERTAARQELLDSAERIVDWYAAFADSFTGAREAPAPLPPEPVTSRLAATVARDLLDANGATTADAVRIIWTGDHLDAARRLQATIAGPAMTAVRRRALAASGKPERLFR